MQSTLYNSSSRQELVLHSTIQTIMTLFLGFDWEYLATSAGKSLHGSDKYGGRPFSKVDSQCACAYPYPVTGFVWEMRKCTHTVLTWRIEGYMTDLWINFIQLECVKFCYEGKAINLQISPRITCQKVLTSSRCTSYLFHCNWHHTFGDWASCLGPIHSRPLLCHRWAQIR